MMFGAAAANTNLYLLKKGGTKEKRTPWAIYFTTAWRGRRWVAWEYRRKRGARLDRRRRRRLHAWLLYGYIRWGIRLLGWMNLFVCIDFYNYLSVTYLSSSIWIGLGHLFWTTPLTHVFWHQLAATWSTQISTFLVTMVQGTHLATLLMIHENYNCCVLNYNT